jgi:hypothetical protein
MMTWAVGNPIGDTYFSLWELYSKSFLMIKTKVFTSNSSKFDEII